jgi:hypothetical protein
LFNGNYGTLQIGLPPGMKKVKLHSESRLVSDVHQESSCIMINIAEQLVTESLQIWLLIQRLLRLLLSLFHVELVLILAV